MSWLTAVQFDEHGLVPVVAQDARSGEVLMLAYANQEALELTARSGRAHYWSRSREELWAKGETSGNTQSLVEIRVDCDGDAILYLVRQQGPACHTGQDTCFYRVEAGGDLEEEASAAHILSRVQAVIGERAARPKEGSYTNYLLGEGLDKILKKVGEEATETVIAAKNEDDGALGSESADLLYHLLVMLQARNVPVEEVWNQMDRRFGREPRSIDQQRERPEP